MKNMSIQVVNDRLLRIYLDDWAVDNYNPIILWAARVKEDTLIIFFTRDVRPINGIRINSIKNEDDIWEFIEQNNLMSLTIPVHSGGRPLLGGKYGISAFIFDHIEKLHKVDRCNLAFSRFDEKIHDQIAGAYSYWVQPENGLPILSEMDTE